MIKQWVCPYCDHAATIREGDRFEMNVEPTVEGSEGPTHAFLAFTVCPNPDCQRTTLEMLIRGLRWSSGQYQRSRQWQALSHQRIMPPTYARPMPEYVPDPIAQDYLEACAIADLSPKASATLARRALQGMVRDFFDVSERNLYLELEAIKDKVDPLTWQAIDAVRQIGNIGAHMEKDINVVVEVDPDEAVRLIRLIEILVKEWYISKYEREANLAALVSISNSKQDQRTSLPPSAGLSEDESNSSTSESPAAT